MTVVTCEILFLSRLYTVYHLPDVLKSAKLHEKIKLENISYYESYF